jgi:hypothetical protein
VADPLTLEAAGAEHRPAALGPAALRQVETALAGQPTDWAGVRLFGVESVRPLLDRDGTVGRLALSVLGGASRPVRAILFDKSPTANWALGWHQDRVIAVRRRLDVQGYGPWTRKHGALHVAPPTDLLARMLTIRVHLDDVSETNAPLLIAPGSHRLGLVPEAEVASVVRRFGALACLARAGDVWLYATLILHASERAAEPGHRRVLQIDFAAEDLPGGLEWLGV